MRRLPYQFLMRYAANVVRARYGRGQNKKLVKPMIAGLYVTMKCNFRCTYCDDGSGLMYPDIPEQRLKTTKTIEVLEILRRASPGLNITGGEPTLRPDIEELFDNIGRLGFISGHLQHQRFPAGQASADSAQHRLSGHQSGFPARRAQ